MYHRVSCNDSTSLGEHVSVSGFAFTSHQKRTFVRITDPSDMMPADYSVASGIMNLKFDTPDEERRDGRGSRRALG